MAINGFEPLGFVYNEETDEYLTEEMSPKEIKYREAMIAFLKKHGARAPSRSLVEDDGPFDGKWRSTRHQCTLKIESGEGTVVLSNLVGYEVGDVIFRIHTLKDNTFEGAQLFMDGKWRGVVGTMKDGVLHIKGGGRSWKMTKLPDASSE
jgi:hypothetical protein